MAKTPTPKKTSEITTPSVLAFERKLSPSDALFFQGNWNEKDKCSTAVVVTTKSVRGTTSNRLGAKDADKAFSADKLAENANLQTVQAASLSQACDTLKTVFTLRVLPVGAPTACNIPAYAAKLKDLLAGYVGEHGYNELGERYAKNLVNGRSLWRNKLNAEKVAVRVFQVSNTESTLVAEVNDAFSSQAVADAAAVVGKLIAAALRADAPLLLKVETFALIGAGQELYPSQEMVMDKGDKGPSKVLYSIDGTAAQHSQKIGNAIRSIDDWYEGADGVTIAVEPYGSVTTQGQVYRTVSSGSDFYTLLDGWLTKDEHPGAHLHYVIAVLIRGGVFGKKADKNEAAVEASPSEE